MRLDTHFHTTSWDLVRLAGDRESEEGSAALEELVRLYWFPLFAYLRRRGKSKHDAADAVQGFFASLLSRGGMARVEEGAGRFRSWLLTSLQYFVNDEFRRASTIKRGGGQRPLSLDVEAAESRYQLEPQDDLDAEALFHRQWALDVLERARQTLRAEYVRRGQRQLFDALASELETGERPDDEQLAVFEMTPVALRVARHRLRDRYADQIRAEARATLGQHLDTDEELRELAAALEASPQRS